MSKLLITNARLVNEGNICDSDVLIHGKRIEKIASGITVPDNTKVLDAAGKLLLPGNKVLVSLGGYDQYLIAE